MSPDSISIGAACTIAGALGGFFFKVTKGSREFIKETVGQPPKIDADVTPSAAASLEARLSAFASKAEVAQLRREFEESRTEIREELAAIRMSGIQRGDELRETISKSVGAVHTRVDAVSDSVSTVNGKVIGIAKNVELILEKLIK